MKQKIISESQEKMLLLIPEILDKYKLPLVVLLAPTEQNRLNILIMQFPEGKTACQSYSELPQKQN